MRIETSCRKRRDAHRFGLLAEHLAAWFLRAKGYRILAMRYRNPLGEIDLLARHGNTLVAVEVKARKRIEECHDAVPPSKQQKIARAMQGLLSGQAAGQKITGLDRANAFNIRFDVIWVVRWRMPRHIPDAWRI